MVELFKRLTRAIWSRMIFFKDRKDWRIEDPKIKDPKIKDPKIKDQIPYPANWYSDQGLEFYLQFSIETMVFCDQKINFVKKIKSPLLIFLKDQWDWFAQGQSFLEINGIDSLTVDLFKMIDQRRCGKVTVLKNNILGIL